MAASAALAKGGIGAVGSIYSGNSQASALKAAAAVQEQNAKEAREAAQFDAAKQGQMADQKIGTATAAYSASGVTLDSGSVMNVLAHSHSNAELDRLNIIHGGEVRAVNYENQASMDKIAASNSQIAGYINAASSLIGGAGSVASAAKPSASVAPNGDSGSYSDNTASDTGKTVQPYELLGSGAGGID